MVLGRKGRRVFLKPRKQEKNHLRTQKKFGEFQSRWWFRQRWLAFSYNHIKITTKMWNNHHSEALGIKLDGSLTTKELKESHPSRLVGGAETWKGLVHIHVWWIKIWEG